MLHFKSYSKSILIIERAMKFDKTHADNLLKFDNEQILAEGGRLELPRVISPAVFKTAALPIRSSPPN